MKLEKGYHRSHRRTVAFALALSLLFCISEVRPVLGHDYHQGHEALLAEDYGAAMRIILPLAEAGNARAQADVGYMHLHGKGIPKDVETAALWYIRAAENGDARAQIVLGAMYLQGVGVPKDPSQAVRFNELAAEQGEVGAQFELGFLLTFGDEGVSQDFERAATWLRKAADQGHAAAQEMLGLAYLEGRGVSPDAQEAAFWSRKSAEQGRDTAQHRLGQMYRDGVGVAQDLAEAARWFRLAADRGNADAQFDLGWFFFNGMGVAQDAQVAARWWRLAAEQGQVVAQFNMGELYRIGSGVSKDLARAVQFYVASAEQGYLPAEHMMGRLHLAGYGVAKNPAQAADWFRRAADKGYADAQYQIGYLYSQGDGVDRSWSEAVAWFRLAAEQGHMNAQFSLGYIYNSGQQGVPRDWQEAVSWYRLAAEQGHASSQHSVGLAYYFGFGVVRNPDTSAIWLRRAADQNVREAQHLLGTMYRDGNGVGRDPTLAEAWFEKAAEQGDDDAQFDLAFMRFHGRGVPVNQAEAVRYYRMAAEQGHAKAQSKLGFIYEFGHGAMRNDTEATRWYALAEEQGIADVPERQLLKWQSRLEEQAAANGRISQEVLRPLRRIAEVYLLELGFHDLAGETYEYGYRVSEEVLGRYHVETLEFLGGYAVGESMAGRYDMALELARDLLARWQQTGGATHRETLMSMGFVARILEHKGEVAAANQVMQEGLAIAEDVYGKDAFVVTSRLGQQVMTVNAENASPVLVASLQNYATSSERDLGRSSLKTLDVKAEYANALSGLGRHLEAVEVWADVLSAQEERLLMASVLDATARDAVIREARQSGRRLIEEALAARPSLRQEANATQFRDAEYTDAELSAALGSNAFYAAQLGQVATASAVARSMARLSLTYVGLRNLFEAYEAAQAEVVELGYAINAQVATRIAGDEAADAQILSLQGARAEAIETVRTIAVQIEVAYPRVNELMTPRPVALNELMGEGEVAPLLGPNEALILLFPPDGDSPGGVWAVSRERFAWSEIARTEMELRSDIQYLHRLLDNDASADTHESVAGNRGAVSFHDRAETARLRPFDREFAHGLYSALFGAAEIRKVIEDKSEWILAPQGMFLSLPFATLVTAPPEGGRVGDANPAYLRETSWLGTQQALSIVPAVSSLRALRRNSAASNTHPATPFFGLGDPVFSGASSTSSAARLAEASSYFRSGIADANMIAELARLPGTRREIEQLAAAFDAPDSWLLLGTDASERGLAEALDGGVLSSSRVIVLATHGLMAGAFDTLSEPALALTPPVCGPSILQSVSEQVDDTAGACETTSSLSELQTAAADGAWIDDGLLTASEITQLKLDADWVILSACDTAAGESQSPDSEGLSGLARSFFFAGARSLLVSHWPVRDDVASRLTPEAVVHATTGGVSRAEALRRAMTDLLNDASLDGSTLSFAHPSAWAPFQVTGVNARGS